MLLGGRGGRRDGVAARGLSARSASSSVVDADHLHVAGARTRSFDLVERHEHEASAGPTRAVTAFCFTPPTGPTDPSSPIVPVIATSCRP